MTNKLFSCYILPELTLLHVKKVLSEIFNQKLQMIERQNFYNLKVGQKIIDSHQGEWYITENNPTRPPKTHNYGDREVVAVDPEGRERYLGWRSDGSGTGICDDQYRLIPELNSPQTHIKDE